MDRESSEILICSLVLSHLDHSNAILYNCSDLVLNKMQRVQNAAAKIVLQRNYKSSSLLALKDLHWLPIRARIEFKILLSVYKCLNDVSFPQYLKDLIIIDKKFKPKKLFIP